VADWPGSLAVYGLVFARTAGMFGLAPPLGWDPVPVGLRLAAAAVLAAPIAMTLGDAAGGSLAPAAFLGLLTSNLAVGLLVGAALWLLVQAVGVAGGFLGLWLPRGDEEAGREWHSLFGLLAVLFFVQLGGLQWLYVFARQTFVMAPLTAGVTGGLQGPWLQWPGLMLGTALRVAAPLVGAMLLMSATVSALESDGLSLPLGPTRYALRHVLVILVLVAMLPAVGGMLLGEMDAWATAAADALTMVH